ncbi:MAG TPA: hypothetical protein VMH87_14640 [Pseudomonadales bacterium]|nr:hypothetical protein [Pseudomonadales bacterium]
MNHHEPADENKYTIGIAASLCLMSLPVIYLGTRPLVLIVHAQWVPWFLAGLFTFVPIFMAFNVVYCHTWHLKWSPLKHLLLSTLLACIIFCADLVLIVFIFLMVSSCPGCIWGHEE